MGINILLNIFFKGLGVGVEIRFLSALSRVLAPDRGLEITRGSAAATYRGIEGTFRGSQGTSRSIEGTSRGSEGTPNK